MGQLSDLNIFSSWFPRSWCLEWIVTFDLKILPDQVFSETQNDDQFVNHLVRGSALVSKIEAAFKSNCGTDASQCKLLDSHYTHKLFAFVPAIRNLGDSTQSAPTTYQVLKVKLRQNHLLHLSLYIFWFLEVSSFDMQHNKLFLDSLEAVWKEFSNDSNNTNFH